MQQQSTFTTLTTFIITIKDWLSRHVVAVTLLLFVISCLLFMTINAHGHWDFILPLRGKKLLGLMMVGYAIGTATLLLQTLTHNPILTPYLLGYDAIYVLIQRLLVFTLGGLGYASLPLLPKYGFEVGCMVLFSVLLFRLLFTKARQDLTQMILVGVIFGILCHSLSNLVARLINPSDFAVIQYASYAQFNNINTQLLSISMVVVIAAMILIWRWRHQCDVLMLGKPVAINLGIDYQKFGLKLLAMIAILVSVSTALVGPVSFFGLLVCALTNRITPNMSHSMRLPLVAFVAMTTLVLGQTIFEQLLGMAGVLSVVIEVGGGIVFLLLLASHYRLSTR
ncbi:iron chelate uptake ABC transporter family permease subunit [Psychrobacter sp. I-STPA10]|uniref:iron chelate uptake ABC transporter family permease subunit n=1 Tax=Psychrobacter sp. I-STPA10 TaxID=2585769 RepID=UPI001E656D41|nr:iron chelate uptake ABC transporter family permease subunit [Psychrobacter sp. I-STPA10]